MADCWTGFKTVLRSLVDVRSIRLGEGVGSIPTLNFDKNFFNFFN